LEIIKKRKTGDKDLSSGMPRNYEIYDPLDFLAEVTQHIPNKGEHQIRFYGWYSNKKRGLHRKSGIAAISAQAESDTAFRRKCRMTWAALIKLVYEVDPLKCPKCDGEIRIVAFIEEKEVVEKILRHCDLWKDHKPRPPPASSMLLNLLPPVPAERTILNYNFFEWNCA
jgi:hypothetical protein